MNTNKFDIYILKKVVILIFCLAVGVLGAGNPIIYLVIPLVLIITLINVVKIDMILEYSFWFVVLTLFLGAYLSVPGFENIYLFRLLLPLHMLLLVIFGNFKWNDFRIYFNYILLLILLLLISVCSLFVADYVELGLRYCYFMVEIICIFILCFYHLKNKKQMKKLFQIISSIFNISLVLGLVENLTGWHLWLSGSNVYVTLTSKLQPTGFLYNTNDYALFMGILYPFAAYLFLEMKHKYLGRLLYIVTTFLTLYIIISTYSRIGMLVAIISITTVYFYQFKKRGSIILFILTPVLFLIIKFTSIGGLMSKTVYSAYTDKFTSTDAREHLYLLLIKIIRDSNFIGVGAGNVPNKLNNLLLGYTSDGYTTGHNYWLETFGNLGFVGFIVCICIFILFLFQLLKSGCLKKSPIPLLIWIAFLGASIALSTILEKRFLWFILAVGICLIKQAYKEGLNRDTC